MPNTESALGRVDPNIREYYWFARPLLLSSRVIRGSVKDEVTRVIDEELALGCDGFVLQLSAMQIDASFAEQMALFEFVLQSYSQNAFI